MFEYSKLYHNIPSPIVLYCITRYWIVLHGSRHCSIQYLIIVIYDRVYCTVYSCIERYYIIYCYTRLNYAILDYGANAYR